MNRTLGILLACVLSVVILGIALYPGTRPAQMPAVTVKSIDGRQIALESLNGRPVLVTFWATTCGSCLEEIPRLSELYRELNPRGLEVIAIAMPYDPPNRVVELAQRRELPYTVALDIAGEAAQAFGRVKVTPNWFLINPAGEVIHHQVGRVDIAEYRRRILGMLPSVASTPDMAHNLPAS